MSQDLKKILILALGGEGGGTLTEWVVEACRAHGWPNQATSIPGVAQRTGATSYYIECLPQSAAAQVPPMCLAPMAGDLDLIISSELLETARAVERGLSAPERTLVLSSSARALTVDERTAMADGRWSQDVLQSSLSALAREVHIMDLGALARREGTIVSAVMFGALAASGVLPLKRELCEKVIADESGQARAAASLRGFAAGFQAVQERRGETSGLAAAAPALAPAIVQAPVKDEASGLDEVIRLGAARLLDFQDQAYADQYRAIVQGFAAREQAPCPVSREAARGLALWMAYEDVIRVADVKSRRSRFEQIRLDYKAGAGEPVIVKDFLKPGMDEIAAILPPAWAERLLRSSARRGQRALGEGMQLNTSSVRGLLAMRMLAGLRFLRRRSSRFLAEQALIGRWVKVMHAALEQDVALARSVAAMPSLIKGYGDTFARGHGNFVRILETLLEPAMGTAGGGALLPAGLAKACESAVRAALADPDGDELLRQLGLPKPAPREHTIHFMRPISRNIKPQ